MPRAPAAVPFVHIPAVGLLWQPLDAGAVDELRMPPQSRQVLLAAGVVGDHREGLRDRLFLFFAVAFWLLGFNWLALACTQTDEPFTALYFVRLSAFVAILLGIWDKNRGATRAEPARQSRG